MAFNALPCVTVTVVSIAKSARLAPLRPHKKK